MTQWEDFQEALELSLPLEQFEVEAVNVKIQEPEPDVGIFEPYVEDYSFNGWFQGKKFTKPLAMAKALVQWLAGVPGIDPDDVPEVQEINDILVSMADELAEEEI